MRTCTYAHVYTHLQPVPRGKKDCCAASFPALRRVCLTFLHPSLTFSRARLEDLQACCSPVAPIVTPEKNSPAAFAHVAAAAAAAAAAATLRTSVPSDIQAHPLACSREAFRRAPEGAGRGEGECGTRESEQCGGAVTCRTRNIKPHCSVYRTLRYMVETSCTPNPNPSLDET